MTDRVSTLREWLGREPFGLTLSSGFFGFFAHGGVLAALEQEGFHPVRVTGSSAGALVATGLASGMGAADFREEMVRLRREHFWDPGFGLGLLRGRLFQQLVEELLPVRTFDETRIPLALSVYDVLGFRTRVIDEGPLAAAVVASCSVPGMFHPVMLDGRPHLDGGVLDRPGILGMPDGHRVLYHHLVTTARWRRGRGPFPQRDNLVSLVLEGLPRVSPDRLDEGPRAFELAYRAALRALDEPFDDDMSTVTVDATGAPAP